MTPNNIKAGILKKFSRKTPDNKMILMSPFVASKANKTLFFHIAKTGGSAIHTILREKGLDDGILSQKRGHFEQKIAYFADIVEHWDEYYKFTMIRNKYAQLVSNWNYDKKNLKVGNIPITKPRKHFRTFIKNIVKTDIQNYDYWIDQYYLTMVDDVPIFDFIGNYDNFDGDLKIAMDHIGIKNYDSKRRVNRKAYAKKLHYSEYYDEDSTNIVYNKFKTEIDYFKFIL